MSDLDLKRLKLNGKDFVKKFISKSIASSSQIFSQLVLMNNTFFEIEDFEYYYPKAIRFVDTIGNDFDTFCVSCYGSVVTDSELEIPYFDNNSSSKTFPNKKNKKFGFITHFEVAYKLINNDEIDIVLVDSVSNFFVTEKDAFNEWKVIKERILGSKAMASVSPNSNLLEKIDAIEMAEDLMASIGEEIDEDMFLDKIIMLQKVANAPKPLRVAYEYGSVAELTNQPVLMNKSLSIFLKKEQVLGLLQDLSKRYKDIILSIRSYNVHNLFKANDYVVPIVFGKTERGHADSYQFKIVLPKLGDWRTGYTNVYTAELVFHEFAHILDSGRKKTVYGKGNYDGHRHDFVKILDMILSDYKDFINKNYSVQMMRDMILNLDSWIDKFKITYDERIKSIKLQEKNRRDSLAEEQQAEQSSFGIGEDSFPLELILKENREDKLNYILYVLDSNLEKNIPDYRKSNILNLRIKILDALDGLEGTLILTKKEINELKTLISDSDTNSFIVNQPTEKQLALLDPLRYFKSDLRDLSENKLKLKEKPKESLVIEDYDIDPIGVYLSERNS